MPRTAQRSATSPSSTDRAAMELLDRTGIVAASLPRRRRRADAVLEAEPIYTRPPVCDKDLRPKSVVIRRRARALLGGGAAVLLVGLGWLAGSLNSGTFRPSDEIAQVDPNPAVAAVPAPQPVALPPVVQQQQLPPVTVTVPVPVPVRQSSPKHVQVLAKPQSKAEADVPRVDLPPSSGQAVAEDPVAEMVQPWIDVAAAMAKSYDTRR